MATNDWIETRSVSVRDLGIDSVWDGRVKNMVYNTVSMAWESQTSVAGGGASTGLTDAQLRATPVPVSNTSLPLPTGASTSANQATQNTSLNNIDVKTPALGQALAGASTPVVLPAAQITALTPPTTISVSNFPASQTVAGSVSVSNLPATQPVSGAVSVSNFPASQTVAGSVSVSNLPATQAVSIASMPSTPVTGTFFQATQPISAVSLPLPTGAALDATLTGGTQKAIARTAAKGTTVAADLTSTPVDANTQALDVSVKNFPATQAVSIASMPTTPVTGTFWQTTQPVSLATAPTTPVTGTFWQTTQPVSIAAMPSTPVTGTFWQATQPVSGTVTANVGTTNGLALDASLTTVNTSVNTLLKPASTLAGVTTVGAVTAITNPLPTGTNSIGTVQPPAITKGAQGATGFTTQDLKDSGRNQTNYFMAAQVLSTATDALMSLTGYKGGVAVTAATTPAVVTAAKTYRITSATLSYVTIVTTPGAVRFTLRANLSGVVAITSPAVTQWTVGEPTGVAPVAGKFNTVQLEFPDGIEFPAGTGIGLSMVGIGATGAAAVVGYGQASIHGYEY